MTALDDWRRFHAANPGVYERLRQLALTRYAEGHKRYSVAMLFEHMRVNGWSIANAHRAYYARHLMDEQPQLRGFFDVAALRDRPDRRAYRAGYRQAIDDAAALIEDGDEAERVMELKAAFDVFDDGENRG